jgi:hypothetical protein
MFSKETGTVDHHRRLSFLRKSSSLRYRNRRQRVPSCTRRRFTVTCAAARFQRRPQRRRWNGVGRVAAFGVNSKF